MKYTLTDLVELSDYYKSLLPNYKLYNKIKIEEFNLLSIFNAQLFDNINIKELQTQLSNIDIEIISDYNLGKFQDYTFMSTLTCIFGALSYEDNMCPINKQKRIRQWLRLVKKIGSSRQNHVFLSSLKDYEDLFVIKTTKNCRININHENVIHDMFIGIYGTNILRRIINNIAFVIGGFTLSPLYISSNDNEILTWGIEQSTISTQYVIYEKIFPSVDLKHFLIKCSPADFLSLYLQILYTLKIANETIDFAHNDLHCENILVRKFCDDDFDMYYRDTSKDVYIHSRFMAILIDLGMSHIKYKDKHYGPFGFERYGITYDSNFIIGDAFRLLISSYNVVINKNKSICDIIDIIFSFFSDESITDFKNKLPLFNILLPKNEYKNMNMSVLIDFILDKCSVYTNDIVSNVPRNKTIIGFPSDNNNNITTILSELGVNEPTIPRKCFELYDIISSIKNPEKIKSIISSFKPHVLKCVFTDVQILKLDSQDILNRLINLKYSIREAPEIKSIMLQTDNAITESYFIDVETLVRIWDDMLLLNVTYEAVDFVIWHYMVKIKETDIILINLNFKNIIKYVKRITKKILGIKRLIKRTDYIIDKWSNLFEHYFNFFAHVNYPDTICQLTS